MRPARSSVAPDQPEEIATVRIELRGSDPAIWRQVDVPTAITLKGLHDIVQAAMGWLDCHLWEFTVDRRRYGLPMDEDWGTQPRGSAGKVRLREVLKPRRTTIDYLYDLRLLGASLDRQRHPPWRAGPRLSPLRRRRAQRPARGLRRHPRLLRNPRSRRRPDPREPRRSQTVARRLRP